MRLYVARNTGTVLVLPSLEFSGEVDVGEVDQTENVLMTEDQKHAEVSADVKKVVEHLRANRTTRGEAREVRDAAEQSIRGHDLARGIGSGGDEE